MAEEIRFVEGGTVTTPQGFKAGATFAGMKTYAEDKLDLGLLCSERPCAAAGLFTANRVRSPSVVYTQEQLAKGRLRAVVANSGIANTMVGEQGMTDARGTAALAAKQLGLGADEVAVCSTGVIGVELPMALIRESMPRIELTHEGGAAFARAILTTDTRPKEVAVTFELGRRKATLGGCVKGSGMIHPNLATMLCFLATDAAVEKGFLQQVQTATPAPTTRCFSTPTVPLATTPSGRARRRRPPSRRRWTPCACTWPRRWRVTARGRRGCCTFAWRVRRATRRPARRREPSSPPT
jgi:glutamate N-acetyltransferase/amino-acid N-acetyltransferase